MATIVIAAKYWLLDTLCCVERIELININEIQINRFWMIKVCYKMYDFIVLSSECSVKISVILWPEMPWSLASPGHHWPQCWHCAFPKVCFTNRDLLSQDGNVIKFMCKRVTCNYSSILKFNGCLAKSTSNLGHGWIIAPHIKRACDYLCIP